MRWTPFIVMASSLLLAGCAKSAPIIKEVIKEVPVPVAVGCVATTGRPDRVQPLRDTRTAEEWAALAPGAKAQAVRAQAGERMNYEDADRAATSGCK